MASIVYKSFLRAINELQRSGMAQAERPPSPLQPAQPLTTIATTRHHTTMDRCKTCKHWAPCASVAHWENDKKAGGICSSDKIVEDRWQGHGADMMVYSYCEDGEFWTGPDFGCVHHQQVDA